MHIAVGGHHADYSLKEPLVAPLCEVVDHCAAGSGQLGVQAEERPFGLDAR